MPFPFSRKSSIVRNAGNGGASISKGSGVDVAQPPSYNQAGPHKPATSEQQLDSKHVVLPSVTVEPYTFAGSPYAESLTFKLPERLLYENDILVKNKGKAVSVAPQRTLDVSFSIPKVAYSGAVTEKTASSTLAREPTLDIYIYLEYPGDDIQEIVVEAIYEPHPEPGGNASEPPRQPWTISASLAAALINRGVTLESKGRFTKKGVWTIRVADPGAGQTGEYQYKNSSWRGILDGTPQAICSTSTYFGPCTVTFRVGLKLDRYSDYSHIIGQAELHTVHWQAVARPIMFDGNQVDYISGYLHGQRSVKLLA